MRGKVEITCVRPTRLLYFNIAANVCMEEARLQTQHTVYIHQTHVEHSLEHVLNVRADGTQTGHLLAVGKPYIDTDSLLPDSRQFQVHVLEGLVERPSWTGDSDLATFTSHRHCRGEHGKVI